MPTYSLLALNFGGRLRAVTRLQPSVTVQVKSAKTTSMGSRSHETLTDWLWKPYCTSTAGTALACPKGRMPLSPRHPPDYLESSLQGNWTREATFFASPMIPASPALRLRQLLMTSLSNLVFNQVNNG